MHRPPPPRIWRSATWRTLAIAGSPMSPPPRGRGYQAPPLRPWHPRPCCATLSASSPPPPAPPLDSSVDPAHHPPPLQWLVPPSPTSDTRTGIKFAYSFQSKCMFCSLFVDWHDELFSIIQSLNAGSTLLGGSRFRPAFLLTQTFCSFAVSFSGATVVLFYATEKEYLIPLRRFRQLML